MRGLRAMAAVAAACAGAPAAALTLTVEGLAPPPDTIIAQPTGYSVLEQRKEADGEAVASARDVRVVLADDGRALFGRDSGAANGLVPTLVFGDERGLEVIYDDPSAQVLLDYGVSSNGTAVFTRLTPGSGREIIVRQPGAFGVRVAEETNARALTCGAIDLFLIGCSVSDAGVAAFAAVDPTSPAGLRAFSGAGGAPTKINFLDAPDDSALEAARILDDGRVLLIERGRVDDVFGLYGGLDTRYRLRTERGFDTLLQLRLGADAAINADLGILAVQTGAETALTLVQSGAAVARLDRSGPFDGFRSPNLSDFNSVAFIGDLDLGGAGIFRGFDPAKDALIVEGDVFNGERVTRVALSSQNAINSSSQLGLSINTRDDQGRDSLYLLRTETLTRFDPLAVAKSVVRLSVGEGQDVTLGRLVGLSSSSMSMSFELDWLFGDAALEVLLGGLTLGVFGPGDAGLWTIDDIPAPLGVPDGAEALLAFRLSGGDAVVDLDAIRFEDVLIGDFEGGGFEGWNLAGTGFARVAATAFVEAPESPGTAPVPLPGAGWLLAAACAAMGLRARRRRGA